MNGPYNAERLAGRRVVVDRLDRDGAALACLLRDRGADVVIADPSPAVGVPDRCRLVHDRGAAITRADLLMADCWTGETAPHVVQARSRSIPVGSLADLVLHEARAPVVGVTGTAGKTITARLIAHLLQSAGWRVQIPLDGRAENAWPNADSLAALTGDDEPEIVVLELTSTHLAYVSASPRHAVITALWPDHVELHGSEGRYIASKQRILGWQQPGDTAVLPAEELRLSAKPGVIPIRFSGDQPPKQGIGVRGGILVDQLGDRERVVCDLTRTPFAPHQWGNVAAAVATVRGALRVADSQGDALLTFAAPIWRGERIATVDGRPVFHNGMAATPAKASAFISELPDQASVLIVGGLFESEQGPVHSSPAETRLLRAACREIARTARRVVLVGPAAARIAPKLAEAGCNEVAIGPDLHWATAEALRDLEGVEMIAWVPAFPVDLADRERFAQLVVTAARKAGRTWVAASAVDNASTQSRAGS